jgi:hypothetical protein
MRTKEAAKIIAEKIIKFKSPEYESLFFDSETLIRIAMSELGYETIRNITIGGLIEGIEKEIPNELQESKKIIICLQ